MLVGDVCTLLNAFLVGSVVLLIAFLIELGYHHWQSDVKRILSHSLRIELVDKQRMKSVSVRLIDVCSGFDRV